MTSNELMIKKAVEEMEIFGDSAGWYAEVKINNLVAVIDFEFNCLSVYFENKSNPYQLEDMLFSESAEELRQAQSEGHKAWRELYNKMGKRAAYKINEWYPGRIKFIKA